MHFLCYFDRKYLHNSKKSSTFAADLFLQCTIKRAKVE